MNQKTQHTEMLQSALDHINEASDLLRDASAIAVHSWDRANNLRYAWKLARIGSYVNTNMDLSPTPQ